MKRFVIAALALVIGAGSVLSFSPVADAADTVIRRRENLRRLRVRPPLNFRQRPNQSPERQNRPSLNRSTQNGSRRR